MTSTISDADYGTQRDAQEYPAAYAAARRTRRRATHLAALTPAEIDAAISTFLARRDRRAAGSDCREDHPVVHALALAGHPRAWVGSPRPWDAPDRVTFAAGDDLSGSAVVVAISLSPRARAFARRIREMRQMAISRRYAVTLWRRAGMEVA